MSAGRRSHECDGFFLTGTMFPIFDTRQTSPWGKTPPSEALAASRKAGRAGRNLTRWPDFATCRPGGPCYRRADPPNHCQAYTF